MLYHSFLVRMAFICTRWLRVDALFLLNLALLSHAVATLAHVVVVDEFTFHFQALAMPTCTSPDSLSTLEHHPAIAKKKERTASASHPPLRPSYEVTRRLQVSHLK